MAQETGTPPQTDAHGKLRIDRSCLWPDAIDACPSSVLWRHRWIDPAWRVARSFGQPPHSQCLSDCPPVVSDRAGDCSTHLPTQDGFLDTSRPLAHELNPIFKMLVESHRAFDRNMV